MQTIYLNPQNKSRVNADHIQYLLLWKTISTKCYVNVWEKGPQLYRVDVALVQYNAVQYGITAINTRLLGNCSVVVL